LIPIPYFAPGKGIVGFPNEKLKKAATKKYSPFLLKNLSAKEV
jgi:hypothetical protein